VVVTVDGVEDRAPAPIQLATGRRGRPVHGQLSCRARQPAWRTLASARVQLLDPVMSASFENCLLYCFVVCIILTLLYGSCVRFRKGGGHNEWECDRGFDVDLDV
jgi:hypothetical protein